MRGASPVFFGLLIECPHRDSNPESRLAGARWQPQNPGNSEVFAHCGCVRSRSFANKCGQSVGKVRPIGFRVMYQDMPDSSASGHL